MASSSLTNIYIFFSISLLFSISNVYSSPPYELVSKVCSKLDDVDFCWQVLQCDKRSEFAENITILTTAAVDVTIKHANATRDMLQVLKFGGGRPGVLKSLKGCINAYSHVISNLKIYRSDEDCSQIGYYIHVAADQVKPCQRIVDSNGAHGSSITTANKVTVDMCRVCESLANLMCKSELMF